MKINKILLIILLSAAFLLRIAYLEDSPPGLYKDEASIGYDAFSILHTGKDFHGHSWPLFFESFEEWKNPIYIYASVPSVALFGLTAFATRLPAALFGLLAVFALFLLVREMFDEKKALLASAFLTVSPWSLQFSRIAFEATALPALFLLALWLFLKGFNNPRSWNYSAIFFALCLYSYGTGRFFVPLFLISLFFIYKTELVKAKKYLVMPILIFFTVSLPLIITLLFSPNVILARPSQVSIFTDSNHSPMEFFNNYPKYFSLNFLFINGDGNLRQSPPNYGKLLWFLAPLLLVGIFSCLIYWKNKNNKLLFAWLLLYPTTGALTADAPQGHATRAIIGIGLFELFAVVGASFLFNLIKKISGRKMAIVIGILFLLLASANAFQFIHDYFYKYPIQAAAPIWFESGLKEAFMYIKQNQNNYDYVIITPSLAYAKIYSAFYLEINPEEIQTNQEKIYQCEPEDCKLKGKLLLLKRADEPLEGVLLQITKNSAGQNAFMLEELDIK